jgi:hypothetical protein
VELFDEPLSPEFMSVLARCSNPAAYQVRTQKIRYSCLWINLTRLFACSQSRPPVVIPPTVKRFMDAASVYTFVLLPCFARVMMWTQINLRLCFRRTLYLEFAERQARFTGIQGVFTYVMALDLQCQPLF